MLVEQFATIDWYTVSVNAGVFVIALIIGLCVGFTAGRNFAIERMTAYVVEKKRQSNNINE